MLSSFQSLDILGRKQEQRLKYSYLPKPESNIDDIYEYDDNKQQKQNVVSWCFRGTYSLSSKPQIQEQIQIQIQHANANANANAKANANANAKANANANTNTNTLTV